MTTFSAAFLLVLVMDPIGNIPVFLSLVAPLDPSRARHVIIRELLIALALLVLFLFTGRFILDLLHITEPALGIAGGIILFLISIKMIFSDPSELFSQAPDGEPFIVPLATPLIAGPSALATVLLLMASRPALWPQWLGAIVLAWFVTGLILLLASNFARVLGNRGTTAIQRLMGMILTTIAVQMLLTGIGKFLRGEGGMGV